jgi:hypothetical protein
MQVTIPKIEGNSKIGNALFSDLGKKDNFKYIVFQPSYEESKKMRESRKQTTEMQNQFKMYKAFQSELPRLSERIKDRIK